MPLRVKTLLWTGILGVLLIGFLYEFSREILLDKFAGVEREYVIQYVERVKAVVLSDLSNLGSLAVDRAQWDATYDEMAHPNPERISRNFSQESLPALGVNLVVLFDPQGRVVYEKVDSMLMQSKRVRDDGIRRALCLTDDLLQTGSPRKTTTGILAFPEGALLLAAHPITRTDDSGTPRGILILGSWLDPRKIRGEARLSGISVSLMRASGTVQQTVILSAESEVRRSLPTVVRTLDSNTIVGYTLMRDIRNHPSLLVYVQSPRRIYQVGLEGMRYVLGLIILVGVILSLGMVLAQERLVLSRLAILSSSLRHIAERRDPASRVNVAGNDELATLGDDINRVLVALDASQKARRESAERFRDIALSMSDWVWETDAEGCYTFFSEKMTEMLSYRASDVFGHPLWELVVPEDRDRIAHVVEQAIGQRQPLVNLENWITTRTGERVCRVTSGVPMFDEEGTFLGFRGVDRDVTKERQAETALRQSEQRFREMADLLPDMVFEVNRELNITYANRTAFEAMSYQPEDLNSGLNLGQILEPESREKILRDLERMWEEKQPVIGTYRIRQRDGSSFLCEAHTAPLVDGSGRMAGARTVGRDISDREEMEQAQRMSAVGHLAAGVAHEFNNILGGLMGRAELARLKATGEGWEELAQTVIRGAARGSEICNNLLRFARPKPPTREPITVEGPLEVALAMAARELAHADIVVRRNYQSGGRRVLADAGQLEQVFLNLIINACHAMPEGGKLICETSWVPTTDGASEIVATITDTGVGIAPKHLLHVFEPFFTTKRDEHSDQVKGTGLGLSVSLGIIQAHNGVIKVRSEVGQGSTFEVRLTTREHEDAEQRPPEEETVLELKADKGNERNILLAEDDEAIRRTLRAVLEAKGFNVSLAADTTETLALLKSQTFDLIISDYLMPGGGGKEVLRNVREMAERPAVIMITGLADDGLFDELTAQGVSRCLGKPFRLANLLEAINELLSAK